MALALSTVFPHAIHLRCFLLDFRGNIEEKLCQPFPVGAEGRLCTMFLVTLQNSEDW